MFANHFASLTFLRRLKNAEFKKLRITSEAAKNTRHVARLDKSISAFKRASMNELRAWKNEASSSIFASLAMQKDSAFAKYFDENTQQFDYKAMSDEGASQLFMKTQTQMQAQIEEEYQMRMAMIEQEVEMRQETELQPLKEYGEDLEAEKLNADQEIAIAKAAHEESKKMAQENIKNLWS